MRGWCTDWGTESGIADCEDLLPEFLKAIGYVGPLPAKEKFLFPRAMWMPGWHHCADGLAKTVLGGFRWWPEWLRMLRSMVKVFRIQPYRSAVAELAKQHGYDFSLFEKCPANFAHWRWGTLMAVLGWLVPIMTALREVWDVGVFAKAKSGALIKSAHDVVVHAAFWQKLRIVHDLMSTIHNFRVWASGCACHEKERQKGEPVVCVMQGRRLPHALQRLEQLLADCAEYAKQPADWHMCSAEDLGAALSLDRSWGFRCLSGIATDKYGFLRLLPWSLGRCRDRSVMLQCRNDYWSLDPNHRDRNADYFFAGALQTDVDSFVDGGDPSPELLEEIQSIEFLAMTEECIEAPHAAMNREKLRQRASSRAWQSATNRLPCNLNCYEAMGDLKGDAFAHAWRNVKRLLQVDPRAANRPKKITWRRLVEEVYRSSTEVSNFKGFDAKPGVGGWAGGGLTKADGAKVAYLSMALERTKFFTLDRGGDMPLLCFQVVWQFSPRAKLVPAVSIARNNALDLGLVWHDVWAAPIPSPGELDVYPSSEIVHVDGLKLAEWSRLRWHLQVWDVEASDLEGCVRIVRPRRAEPTLKLGLADPAVPVIMLLDALKGAGWELTAPGSPAKVLTSPHPSVFARSMMFCRPYLQRLVCLSDLFDKGLRRLVHSAPVSYYSLIMRTDRPGDIDPKKEAAYFSRLLVDAKPASEFAIVDCDEDGFNFSGDEGPALLHDDAPEAHVGGVGSEGLTVAPPLQRLMMMSFAAIRKCQGQDMLA